MFREKLTGLFQVVLFFEFLEKETDIKLTLSYAELIQFYDQRFLKPAENLLIAFSEPETVLNNWDRELLFYFKGLLCVLHNNLTDYYRQALTRLTRGKTMRLVPERKSKAAEVRENLMRLLWRLHDRVVRQVADDDLCKKLHRAIDDLQQDLQSCYYEFM